MSTKQAIENMEYVRRLLEQKQPEFAACLEFATSLVETRQGATSARSAGGLDLGGDLITCPTVAVAASWPGQHHLGTGNACSYDSSFSS